MNLTRRELLRLGVLGAGGLALSGLVGACGSKSDVLTAPTFGKLLAARKDAGDGSLDVFLGGGDYVASGDNYLVLFLQQAKANGSRIFGSQARLWIAQTTDPAAKVTPVGPIATPWYTLCVNPLPKKTSIRGVVHSRGGREFPQFRNPAEALLGSLTRDPERFSQLAPGVPETSGSCHDAGELVRGDPESIYRRLDGLQGAPVASVDEAAADDALAHGGAPGVAAATQGHRSVDSHGATPAVGPQDGVACEATNDGRLNMP